MKLLATTVVILSLGAPLRAGSVIISEIMYNPDSVEGRTSGETPQPCMTEWVELYNGGAEAADLSGWTLADEDGSTGPIAAGTTLAPGEAIVIIPAECDPAEFHAAWGDGFAIAPVTGWGRPGLTQLANSPSDVNEILRLVDAEGVTVDIVNYDDEGDWPPDAPDGPSIYLKPGALDADANDHGVNWARSATGVHGARQNVATAVFNGRDFGSPGTVATTMGQAGEPPVDGE